MAGTPVTWNDAGCPGRTADHGTGSAYRGWIPQHCRRSSPRRPGGTPSTAPRWPAPAAFSMTGHIDRQNAKYGRLGVRLSAHHARAARHDMRRRRHHHHHHRKGQRPAVPAPDDRGAPGGRRGRLGRCCLRRRQELQRHRGRGAVSDSKLNARVKGFNAGAEMPGSPRGAPGDLPPDAQPSGQGRAGTGRPPQTGRDGVYPAGPCPVHPRAGWDHHPGWPQPEPALPVRFRLQDAPPHLQIPGAGARPLRHPVVAGQKIREHGQRPAGQVTRCATASP